MTSRVGAEELGGGGPSRTETHLGGKGTSPDRWKRLGRSVLFDEEENSPVHEEKS